jgi:hypothetical protein
MEVDNNRMWPEQRKAERVRANLPVRWEALLEKNRGTISDISTSGCFILTGGAVKPHEPVSMEIEVPSIRHMQLWGIVVYSTEPIGFALRFKDLSTSEQRLLSRAIDQLRARSTAAQTNTQPNQSSEMGS